MLKNPFVSTKHQFKMMPRISSNNAKDIVAKKLLWTYIGYWGTFFLWLIVSHNFIPMIFILGSLMWCAGGIAAMKLPEESSRIANKTRFYIFTYIAGLLAWRVVLNIIVETPVEMWERALMMRLPPAFASSFLGFITMTFVVGIHGLCPALKLYLAVIYLS